MIIKETNSAEQTEKLGFELGKNLFPGSILCLTGDLGAGKTALTGGLAKGLGIEGYITSPTFTIVNEYSGRLPLYHFDVYRLADPEELMEIGFEEYLTGGGVLVIEWGNLVKELLPREFLEIDIRKNPSKGNDVREFAIKPHGSRYEELVRGVKE